MEFLVDFLRGLWATAVGRSRGDSPAGGFFGDEMKRNHTFDVTVGFFTQRAVVAKSVGHAVAIVRRNLYRVAMAMPVETKEQREARNEKLRHLRRCFLRDVDTGGWKGVMVAVRTTGKALAAA